MIILQQNWHSSITEFGTQLGFNIWDWSAVLISICSVMIAIGSLTVAFKTLKSQKKTEKNTTPSINQDVQLFLLNNKLKDAYESFIHLLVLQISLEGLKVNGETYKVKPTSQFWDVVRLNVADLHEEIFYNDIKGFTHFHTFVNFVNFYNYDIELLQQSIEKDEIDPTFKKSVLKKCIENLFPIIQLWHKCLRESFNIENAEIAKILDSHIIHCSNLSMERIFKIRNLVLNSDVQVVKYAMQEHPGNVYISPYLDTLQRLLNEFTIKNKVNVKIRDFNENTLCWVDSIMMNTLYSSKGPLISFIYNENTGNGGINIMLTTSDSVKSSFDSSFSQLASGSIPSTWLYQIVNITPDN